MSSVPAALGSRQRTITLANGQTVVVEKWGWAKLQELFKLCGSLENVPKIAEQSVRPEDREKLKDATDADLLEIAAVSTELNMSGQVAKNVGTLAKAWAQLSEGMDGIGR